MSIPPEMKIDFFEACKEKSPYIMKKNAHPKTHPSILKKKNQRDFFMIELEMKDLEKIPF